MASISQNQYDYLNNLVQAGGGNGEWAKSQLNGATVYAPPPVASAPSNPVPKPAQSTSTPYSQGNSYGGSSSVPAPSTASYSSSPNYTSSAPSYSVPAPAAPSYSGQSNVIGNVSGSSNTNQSYQNIYDNYRANNPGVNQINTYSDKTGNVYNTTSMTPQQTYALMLNKDGNQNSNAILSGMGLDINGNPVYAPPPVNYTKNAQVDAMPIDQQLAYYKAHPQEAQQEIARAQSVGGSAAQSWASQLSSMVPQTGQQQGGGQQGMSSGATQLSGGGYAPAASGFGQLSPAQIQAEAQSKIAQQIAERTRIANQTKAGYNTSFDRLNKLTQDNRALENVSNQRNLNPFSGKSDYAQGMIAREREITDRQNQQDLQSKLGSVDSQLGDFLNQTPEMQQQIINDLTRQEREYGLQVGTLTGNLNGTQTLAGKDQEFSQARQTKVDNWNAYMDSIGLTGNLGSGAKADWSLLGGTGGAPTLAAKSTFLQQEGQRINNEIATLELQNYPAEQKLKIQQLQKQIAEIGRAPYQSAVDAEYDKIKLDTAKEQLRQLTTGDKPGEKAETADDYAKKYLDGLAKYDNEGTLINGNALESQILMTGRTEAEMRKMYARYGLKWGD